MDLDYLYIFQNLKLILFFLLYLVLLDILVHLY